MLSVFLSRSGGCAIVPDAVAVIPGDAEGEVKFIDAAGHTLVVFRRRDLITYTKDGHMLDEEESYPTTMPF